MHRLLETRVEVRPSLLVKGLTCNKPVIAPRRQEVHVVLFFFGQAMQEFVS